MDFPSRWHALNNSDKPEEKKIAELMKAMAEALWTAKDLLGYRSPKYGHQDAERYIDPVLRRFWDWKQ